MASRGSVAVCATRASTRHRCSEPTLGAIFADATSTMCAEMPLPYWLILQGPRRHLVIAVTNAVATAREVTCDQEADCLIGVVVGEHHHIPWRHIGFEQPGDPGIDVGTMSTAFGDSGGSMEKPRGRHPHRRIIFSRNRTQHPVIGKCAPVVDGHCDR